MKLLTILLLSIPFPISAQVNWNGTYTALEQMASITPYDAETKWYHFNDLLIKGDSVFLKQSPVSIRNRQMSWSSSDGGFYYWKGTVSRSGITIKLKLIEESCDYCGEPVKMNPDGTVTRIYRTKDLAGSITKAGLLLNGRRYQKTSTRRRSDR